MPPLQDTGDEQFEREFSTAVANFRGTEQEIVIFKTVAFDWFRRGRASILSHAERMIYESAKAFSDLRDKL